MNKQELEKFKTLLKEELEKKFNIDEILSRSMDDIYHAISEIGKDAIEDKSKREEVRSLIEIFLNHPYDQWRYISLYTLGIRWGDVKYEEYFDNFMFNDIDEDNRALGIRCYEDFYRGSKNKIILSKILRVFLNDSNDYVRKYAYDALCSIYYADVNSFFVVKSDVEMKNLSSLEILKKIVNQKFINEVKKYCDYKQ